VDGTAVLDLLPILETSLADSRALPWRGSIRQNRSHVGFSLSYVLLLPSLFADAERFDRAAAEVLDFAQELPTGQLGRGFFRTSANLTKCLGLITVRQARAGNLDEVARIGSVIEAALMVAIEVRELREALFPLKRNLPRIRPDRSGPLGAVKITNEFKGNMRAHRISACVQRIAEPATNTDRRVKLAAEALGLCVSKAYPAEREAQIERFDTLFAPQTG